MSTMRTSELIHKFHNKLIAKLREIKSTNIYTDVKIYYTIQCSLLHVSAISCGHIQRGVL